MGHELIFISNWKTLALHLQLVILNRKRFHHCYHNSYVAAFVVEPMATDGVAAAVAGDSVIVGIVAVGGCGDLWNSVAVVDFGDLVDWVVAKVVVFHPNR